MMRYLALIAVLICTPIVAHTEEVVAALSQNRISITANFDGSEILVFGAIKRETAAPSDSSLDVIVTVSGPEKIEIVRRKDRRLGIWVNVDSNLMGHTPTFYTTAATRPVHEIVSDHTDALWKISAEERILPNLKQNASREALLRLRTQSGLYSQRDGGVTLDEDTLFSTSIALPANLVEGDYTTRILLLRDGNVLDDYSTKINVQKVGIERWMYNMAQEKAFLYGLLSLAIATFAGWGASEAFRLLRR